MIVQIATAGPYNTFYLLAFALAAGLAWRHGVRRGWDPARWAALIAIAAAGGVAGSKLIFFSLTLGAPGQKTFLGGVVGGALAFLAGRRLLGLSRSATGDAFAVPLPVAAAVGRVGCFLAGCCFGAPTALPWGVRYAAGSEALDAQAAAGLVAPGAALSLPVHPVQLYEAALDLLLAALVARHGWRFRRPDSAALASFAGLGAIRFVVEFGRFEGGAPALLGLRTVQWTVLAATLALAALVVWRERGASSGTRAAVPAPAPAWRPAAVLTALLAAAAWSGTRWLTPVEALTVVAALGAGLAVAVRAVHSPVVRLLVRRPLQPAAAAMLVLQAGTPPDSLRRDTLPTITVRLDSIAGSPLFPRAYVTVGASGMRGEYTESCGGVHDYQAAGASLKYTFESSQDQRQFVQLLGFVGHDQEQITAPDGSGATLPGDRLRLAGGGIGVGMDRRLFGGGIGAFAGDLASDGQRNRGPIPFGYLRLGPESQFFVDLRVGMPEPVGFPSPIVQIGGGHRFDPSGSMLRAGLAGSGPFISGTIVTVGGFEIEPFASYADTGTFHTSIALRKRFGVGARK